MRTTTRKVYLDAVQAAVEALATGLDEPTSLEALAAEACLSPFHFHRVFAGMVGESPGEFHRRLRLERAAYRIITTRESITAIAFDAGYQAHEAFIRAFRAVYYEAPSRFRVRSGARFELAASCGVHYDPAGHVPAFVPRDTGGKNMNVDILEQPELRLATVRHIGPYNQIPEAFDRLCHVAGPAGLFNSSGAHVLAVYYDDPEQTPATELRSDAAIVLGEGIACPDQLTEGHIPGGKYARYTHLGPYEQIGDAWARLLGEWLPSSGLRMGEGETYEIYMNDPGKVEMAEIRTDLYVPVR